MPTDPVTYVIIVTWTDGSTTTYNGCSDPVKADGILTFTGQQQGQEPPAIEHSLVIANMRGWSKRASA